MFRGALLRTNPYFCPRNQKPFSMEKIINALFSMRAMAIGMTIFFVAIGLATFIESAYGVQASKFWIYNAWWFEALLVFLALNLIANIFRYEMWKREKIALFAFHLSFIIILIGAGVTRWFGFEGLMLVREGESADFIYSSDPYLWYKIDDQKMQLVNYRKLFLADCNWNSFSFDEEFPNHKNEIKFEYVDFLSKHVDSLVIHDSIKGSALEIVTDGMKSNYLPEDDVFILGNTQISFGSKPVSAGINVYEKNGQLLMRPNIEVMFLPMAMMIKARQTGAAIPDSAYVHVQPGQEAPFATTTLYTMAGEQFVFKGLKRHAKKYKLPSGRKDVGSDYLIVRVSDGKESKIVTLEGGMGMIPTPEFFVLGGLRYQMEYGSRKIELPFSIRCNDFIIERYPGSNVASSYASDLQVLDSTNNYFRKKRVFMNHVMDYGGYRFFQSGFDQDEKGTRLSVNFDFWGTNITYLGYLLMSIGMILSLFAPSGRFRELARKLGKYIEIPSDKASMLLILFALSCTGIMAQEGHEGHNHTMQEQMPQNLKALIPKNAIHKMMSEEHSEELAKLLVQDFDGRIVPMHTVCDQILRKLYRSNKYEGKNAVQVVISMHMYPDYWMQQKVIQVPAAVRDQYGLEAYASMMDLSNDQLAFKWMEDYERAFRARESERNEVQKKLIKLVEKYEVFQAIRLWSYLKIIPVKNDPGNNWFAPLSPEIMQVDSLASDLPLRYFTAVHKASDDGKYGTAQDLLTDLKAWQREIAPASILPSDSHVKTEIIYNKMSIFKNVQYAYFLLGISLIILFFILAFKRKNPKAAKRVRMITILFFVLTSLIFLYHATGMWMRWYISGHVPWSNGYEAIVFIAWMTVLAGFIFSRYSFVILAAAALLAFFMIFVSEMNLLDPEITPLQPVLKSYWLMIHVAIITGSYGFLGLAAILGLINLLLYCFRNSSNAEELNPNINILTYVSEMTMTIGLFMLTIGTFLGGIWANESWGRYWGWDPKETWALVSVLVYAIILHFRFIPALKGKFLFNVLSLWGYSAILFTFFGVNFILVGLHSYANGEGSVGLPMWAIFTILGFIIFTIIAAIRNNKYMKQQHLEL